MSFDEQRSPELPAHLRVPFLRRIIRACLGQCEQCGTSSWPVETYQHDSGEPFRLCDFCRDVYRFYGVWLR